MNYKQKIACVPLFFVCWQTYLSSSSAKLNPLYADYVVIGVGTAGAIVARMLSDDMKTSVVALHLGTNLTEDPEVKFSENALTTVLLTLFGIEFSKRGDTTKQVNADLRQLFWVLAKPEGGASSVNAGAYCRGTNQVYSQWEQIAGPNWSVQRILDLYKRLETYKGETTDTSTRGFHGPINVRQVQLPTQVAITFTNAIVNGTGVPFVLDYNDPNTPIGASSRLQYTQRGQDGALRVSSATAFLGKSVMTASGFGVNGRKLRVLFEATGLRTLWNNKTAIGVEYFRKGKYNKVFAKKGVIVCGGLQSSPFLMHSGIGPKKLLRSLEIPIKFDNPYVGENLTDQSAVVLLFSTNPNDTPLPPVDPNNLFAQIAWLPDPNGSCPTTRVLRFASVNPIPGFAAVLFDLLQPRSRGTIKIKSRDPFVKPVVNLGVLTDSADLQLLQRGLQEYIAAINTELQTLDPQYKLIFPDPAILNDSDLVAAFIRQSISSDQHFQSHCRMAALEEGGVVDSRGRVYGVKNLFVADNSIVPQGMDGSPMATAFLIAANVAQMIIEHNKRIC